MSGLKRQRSSVAWNFFSAIDLEFAKCDLCSQKLSYRSSVTNLVRHMQRKHPAVSLSYHGRANETTVTHCQVEPLPRPCIQTSAAHFEVNPVPSTSSPGVDVQQTVQERNRLVQSSMVSYAPRKVTGPQKKELDNLLVEMIVCDLQPFQIVENRGFKAFVKALNPQYVLPTRQTISKSLIPALHEQCQNRVRDMVETVTKVCVTTDCWTSINNESFMAVTGHFVTDNYQLKSVLLECCLFEGAHTSENLARELSRIVRDYRLENKILLAVSDNAANITRAITDLHWKHFGCFAHQVNLIVNKAISSIEEPLGKVKSIVKFFRRSTQATEKLMNFQRNSGQLQPRKLIADVPTRWNSTLYMLQRFCDLEDAVKSTVALLDKELPLISLQEWKMFREICRILQPLEMVTKAASGEKYVSGSLVIVLVNGLNSAYEGLESEDFSSLSKNVINCLKLGIRDRFNGVENSNTLALCTLLDPRFKTHGFKNTAALESCKKKLHSMVASKIKPPEVDQQPAAAPTDKYSPWAFIDGCVAKARPVGTPMSRAIVEVQRYLDSYPLLRTEDPLKWWKEHKVNFPHLGEVAQEMLCVSCTSVPCESVFSKGSLVFSDKRVRLKGEKAQQIPIPEFKFRSVRIQANRTSPWKHRRGNIADGISSREHRRGNIAMGTSAWELLRLPGQPCCMRSKGASAS